MENGPRQNQTWESEAGQLTKADTNKNSKGQLFFTAFTATKNMSNGKNWPLSLLRVCGLVHQRGPKQGLFDAATAGNLFASWAKHKKRKTD